MNKSELWRQVHVTQTSCRRAVKLHLGSHQKAKDVANIGEEVHEELQQAAAAKKENSRTANTGSFGLEVSM